MRPRSITLFHYLMIAIFAIGIIQSAIALTTLGGAMRGAMTMGVVLVSVVVGYGLNILFWYLIVRQASNVARWIYVVMTIIGLVSSSLTIGAVFASQQFGMIQAPMMAISLVLQVASIVMLFRADSRHWFANKGIIADPNVFE